MAKYKKLIVSFLIISSINIFCQKNVDTCYIASIKYYKGEIANEPENCDTVDIIKQLIINTKGNTNFDNYLAKYIDTNAYKKTFSVDLNYTKMASPNRTTRFCMLYHIYYHIFLGNTEIYSEISILKNKKKNITEAYLKNSVELSNNDFKKIYKLYLKWINKIELVGLKEARKQKISPFNHTKYEWRLVK